MYSYVSVLVVFCFTVTCDTRNSVRHSLCWMIKYCRQKVWKCAVVAVLMFVYFLVMIMLC